ncbi:MAG: vanadium nitrogenase [Lachnospiraceae bacterium]|nr:vanadium nitrogenase [Lachnospiraceae bacterium]MDE6981265.1 vanadium nitrogenase [Lachnospiraceae bacterium]
MAFVATLLRYVITLFVMAVVAGLGIFTGKKLRDRKDAKTAEELSARGQD